MKRRSKSPKSAKVTKALVLRKEELKTIRGGAPRNVGKVACTMKI
jgi:hypothetical protein